jgi:hypothetical protein
LYCRPWGGSATSTPTNGSDFPYFPGINLFGGRFITVDGKDGNLTGPIGPELLGRLLDRHAYWIFNAATFAFYWAMRIARLKKIIIPNIF